MELTFDKGVSIFIGAALDDIRAVVKEDLTRYDVSPADRLRLHKLEDALNLVISQLGVKRPKRLAKELPDVSQTEEWIDEAIVSFLNFPLTGEATVVYDSPPEGTPEMIEERKREVAQKKRERQQGIYSREIGRKPKFRLEE